MGNVYRIDIGSQIDSRGVMTWDQKGEVVDVQGVPMVRLQHGVIVRSHGWSEDMSDARLKAAMRIEEMGRSLLAQAERMRSDAAPKEAVA